MTVKNVAESYLTLVSSDEGEETSRIHKLIRCLDELALAANGVEFVFDEKQYPDPPDGVRGCSYHDIGKLFPSLGYYNAASNTSEELNKDSWNVGDAIDDLMDIGNDLKEFVWRCENTSEQDALFYFDLMFRKHWGWHLRSLQLYLHEVFLWSAHSPLSPHSS